MFLQVKMTKISHFSTQTDLGVGVVGEERKLRRLRRLRLHRTERGGAGPPHHPPQRDEQARPALAPHGPQRDCGRRHARMVAGLRRGTPAALQNYVSSLSCMPSVRSSVCSSNAD